MKRTILVLGVAAAGTLLLAACGDDGGTSMGHDMGTSDGRQVMVAMKELKFDPASLKVKTGETVTFVFTNDDTIRHDAFVGDEAAQDAHEAEMASASGSSDHEMTEGSTMNNMDSGGEHGMDAGEGIVVDPGMSGELTYTFDEAGTILVGCHEPGHYAAGMKVTIEVD